MGAFSGDPTPRTTDNAHMRHQPFLQRLDAQVNTTFWVLALLVMVGRFLIPGHSLSWAGTYEAFAHIWVGALLAAWWFDPRPRYPVALLVATAVEIIMFAVR